MSDAGSSAPDVFLSYAHQNEARARDLAAALEGEGFAVFWDREVPPGQTWQSYIGGALANAKCMVVVWSTHAVTSKWVIEEANEGRDREILVPVLLDAVKPPFGFRHIQAANLADWQPGRPSSAFDALLDAVRRIVGGQPGSGTGPATPLDPDQDPAGPPLPPRSGPSYRSLALMIIAGLIAVVGLGSAGVYWWQREPSAGPEPAAGPGTAPAPAQSEARPSHGTASARPIRSSDRATADSAS